MPAQPLSPSRKIAIIGSGFSGLCLGIQLKLCGHEDFTLFEKARGIGGTWRDNTYPGAECDIPSALYSFSFERNPDWTHKWSAQDEILRYLERCSRKYGLSPHIRCNVEVLDLELREPAGKWMVRTSDGGAEEFDVVVSAVGQLDRPKMPAIPGMASFAGPSFHSARWEHRVALDGKNVGCIGNAASALQFVPQIAPKAQHLTVFQRTANWVIPKNDRAYTAFEKKLAAMFPPLMSLDRLYAYLRCEGLIYPLMCRRGGWFREKAQRYARHCMAGKISNRALRRKLVPDYPMGAKRILFSDDYYDALARDNVEVVTEPIECIEAGGVKTSDGRLHPADVLIHATGFETTSFLTPMRVQGVGGEVLNDKWAREGAQAYLGITHTGFPNFFMMYGPNTNLGHNSIVIMIEAQARYILSCLTALDQRNARSLDVKAGVQRAYNEWVQQRLADSAWAAVARSWYKDEAGRITNNWVGRTTEYRRRTRAMNPEDYEFA